MCHLLYISEQHQRKKLGEEINFINEFAFENIKSKSFFYKPEVLCFQFYKDEDIYSVDTNYFIGVDWIVPEKAAVYIEPKLNNNFQVDFLGMLLKSLEASENIEHIEGLIHIEFDRPWISIPTQKDILSPVLIIQFLKIIQKIVRKGLKKSYYRVTENLNGRIKGKILVSRQIKENIVKNRITRTICNYQDYGIHTEENQFLKLVLTFVCSYINQNQHVFGNDYSSLKNILNYCLPSFEPITILKNKHQQVQINKNPFYKEYEDAIKIGNFILKRFSFNINKTSQSQSTVPPFWIDMSKLFELYVYRKLKERFPEPGGITYHDRFKGGKETDILVKVEGYKCVIDCKYKPSYEKNTVSLPDKRQLAGYTRMKSVYEKLAIPQHELIKGLIIYSHQECADSIEKNNLFTLPINEYVEFYKLGLKLPELTIDSNIKQ